MSDGCQNYDKGQMSAEELKRMMGQARSSFAAPTLLERVMAELMARRGSADMTAAEKKRDGKQVEAVGWECRAAGLAEAIAVCQLFNDAARSNEKGQR